MKRFMAGILALISLCGMASGSFAETVDEEMILEAEVGSGVDEAVTEAEDILFQGDPEALSTQNDVADAAPVGNAVPNGVAVNETTFPDVSFRKYVLQNFDLNGDGSLSTAECEKVKAIDVEDMGITSLEGIGRFANLETLYCSWNALTKLDLTKNTRLKELECNHNKLTGLDLSKNKALNDVGCAYNQLTSVNVKKCTKLKYMCCENNRLTQLDVSKNTKLEYLDCYCNRLKKLTMGKNKKLTSLECYGNSALKSINLAGCDKLRKPINCQLDVYEDDESGLKVYGWPAKEGPNIRIDRTTKLYNGKKVLYKPGNPKSVAFKKKSLTLKVGKDAKLSLTMKPAGVASVCTFTSSKPSVVSVESYSGWIFAEKKGTATITVKTANGKKAKTKVTVK